MFCGAGDVVSGQKAAVGHGNDSRLVDKILVSGETSRARLLNNSRRRRANRRRDTLVARLETYDEIYFDFQ